MPPGGKADEDAAGGICRVAEVVDCATGRVGESARPHGVDLVVDADFEGSVEADQELVLTSVDVRRGRAARAQRPASRTIEALAPTAARTPMVEELVERLTDAARAYMVAMALRASRRRG